MLTEEQVAEKMAELEAAKVALAKVEEEKENYRKGLLSREEELKTLKTSKEGEEEEDKNKEIEWDDASKKFQEETLSKTTKLAEEAAVAATMKAINSTNEKVAQEKFRATHTEVTDADMVEIMANYTNTGNPAKDLDRALILTKFDRGEIIDPAEINRRQAEERNRDMNISHGTLSGSGKYEEQKGGLTDGARAIAGRFGISAEALEKEDDSRQATISIIRN